MQKHTTPVTLPRRYPSAPLVGVAAAVFNDTGEVLMVKRGRPPGKGDWGLPGGLLDLGETLKAGAAREVREECNVEIDVGEVVATFEPLFWDNEGRVEYHYVVIDFWATYLSGEAHAQDDADEVAWIAMGALGAYNLKIETSDVIHKAYQAKFADC